MLLCLMSAIRSSDLVYNFDLSHENPELKVEKRETTAPATPKTTKKLESPGPQKEDLKALSKLQPIVDLGTILQAVAKSLRRRKKRAKRRKRKLKSKKSKKLKSSKMKKNELKLKPQGKSSKVSRKAFSLGAMGAMAGGGAMLGGGALLAMKAKKAAAKRADLKLKTDKYGIMVIQKQINKDVNQTLFSAAQKIRALRMKAKTILKNNYKKIDMVTYSIDNIMGNLMAMDRNLFHALRKGRV